MCAGIRSNIAKPCYTQFDVFYCITEEAMRRSDALEQNGLETLRLVIIYIHISFDLLPDVCIIIPILPYLSSEVLKSSDRSYVYSICCTIWYSYFMCLIAIKLIFFFLPPIQKSFKTRIFEEKRAEETGGIKVCWIYMLLLLQFSRVLQLLLFNDFPLKKRRKMAVIIGDFS